MSGRAAGEGAGVNAKTPARAGVNAEVLQRSNRIAMIIESRGTAADSRGLEGLPAEESLLLGPLK